ncbi:uncharacterized protein DUF1707 [Actinoplanes teichomyceticus]|uniref:Uncharacterized protein DUF1707 n=2 Tax=Actinoplanes teichomyceticus TaxID=1867 RepID=A0A561VQJ6_ACTTI|nr:uncharacterized protein DUF1707 [Actinoplanes teichomyceticus]GIF12292.1 hypothetical protein Ate01nite_23240 [Actinoplanes teichomyceticus]
MRAGDSDRQRVADQLKFALDEGRLDLNEYDERVQRAYAARTYGDLDGLLDDLPGAVPPQRARIEPHAAQPVPAPGRPGGHGGGRHTFTSAVAAFVICTLVWAITVVTTGHAYYFWPAWVLIPVVVTGIGAVADRGRRGR